MERDTESKVIQPVLEHGLLDLESCALTFAIGPAHLQFISLCYGIDMVINKCGGLQGRSQDFSRGTHNFPNAPSSPLPVPFSQFCSQNDCVGEGKMQV